MTTETEERITVGPPPDQAPGGTWVVWAVIGTLVLLFVIGGILAKKSKMAQNLDFEGTRAVVLPGDVPRTVVVPPCGTGVDVTPQTAASQTSVSGTTTVELPAGTGQRSLLIPRCTTPAQTESPTSNVPSAAFVLPEGTELTLGIAKPTASAQGIGTYRIQSQVTMPTGSPVRTLVVPACPATQRTSRSPTEYVVSPLASNPTVALAPHC